MTLLNQLPIDAQMALVDRISQVSPEQLDDPDMGIGRFHRDGRVFHRIRAGDYRCYFEIDGALLYSHYILHRKSVTDFAYRNKLPVNEESMAEQHTSFWGYLESLTRRP